MVKKLYSNKGFFFLNKHQLPEEQCQFMIQKYPEKQGLMIHDYLLMYYLSKGFYYSLT